MTTPEECYNRVGRVAQRLHSSTRLFSMFRSRPITFFSLMFSLLGGVLWAAPQKAQRAHTVRVKSTSRQAADPVTPPAPPAPPPTLEQLPAQPPQVSYLNGQLTIISRNSTLSDILHAVARRTGADIELPPGAGFERVAGRMGPGPARNVLAELLNGSRYDYVMVGSAATPGGLQHVILSPKTSGAVTPAPAPVAAYSPQPGSDESEPPPDSSADQQEIPPEAPNAEATPAPPSAYDHAEEDSPQPGNQAAPGVKTPQQLLQELQRMQQQQQQQQQNQPQ